MAQWPLSMTIFIAVDHELQRTVPVKMELFHNFHDLFLVLSTVNSFTKADLCSLRVCCLLVATNYLEVGT